MYDENPDDPIEMPDDLPDLAGAARMSERIYRLALDLGHANIGGLLDRIDEIRRLADPVDSSRHRENDAVRMLRPPVVLSEEERRASLDRAFDGSFLPRATPRTTLGEAIEHCRARADRSEP